MPVRSHGPQQLVAEAHQGPRVSANDDDPQGWRSPADGRSIDVCDITIVNDGTARGHTVSPTGSKEA